MVQAGTLRAEPFHGNVMPEPPYAEDIFFIDAQEGEPFDHEELFDEEEEDEQHQENDDGLLRITEVGFVSDFLHYIRRESVDAPGCELVDQRAHRAQVQEPLPSDQGQCAKDEFMLVNIDMGAAAEASSDLAGRFEKRSPWWVEGWRPRTYILSGSKLLYFTEERPDKPLGVLDFRLLRYEVHCCWLQTKSEKEEARRACDVCIMAEPEGWQTFFLKPKSFPNKIFAFRGPEIDIKILASKIAKAMSMPRFKQPALKEQEEVSAKNFWRYPYVGQEEFLSLVESGDILLFRTGQLRSVAQRLVTSSCYDHVGLLLRSEDNQVLMLEALGNYGVGVLPWKDFVKAGWHKCYTRLAFRKVYFSRTTTQLNALQDYVESVIGSHYSLTVKKLLKRRVSREFDKNGKDITPESLLQSETISESGGDTTFFCSELVAACLKRCGVLAGARASSQYWPGSFSQHSLEPLPLHEGVYLGQEQIILVNS